MTLANQSKLQSKHAAASSWFLAEGMTTIGLDWAVFYVPANTV